MDETGKKKDPNGSLTGYSLLDGATSHAPAITPLMKSQLIVAADISLPLEDRLEAYEDIIDSEIGDTNLNRARNIERVFNLRQIFLKFEGGNPTGTQKDRIAFEQSRDALRRGFDAITVATCGNYGVAIALASSLAGLKCYIYIPENYHTKRIAEIEKFNAIIIRVKGDYEAAVRISRERAEKDEIYDANPGGANTATQLKAYGNIAYEIYDELRDAPSVIAVPVSNGTTMAGIYKGFVSLYRRGKTTRVPKFIAGSSHGKNPIIQAFKRNLNHCEDLMPEKIKETAVNEPLVNWHSIDGDLALDCIRNTEGHASYASDRNMLAYSRQIRDLEGLHVLPASTAGMVVLLEKHKKEPFTGEKHVIILTGRKS